VIGGTLTATNLTIGANTELAAFNGGVLTVSGGSIGAGDAVGAGPGGTARIAGSAVNSASLEAIGTGLVVLGGTLINTKGHILASGSGARGPTFRRDHFRRPVADGERRHGRNGERQP
jgi:hypothetical protein